MHILCGNVLSNAHFGLKCVLRSCTLVSKPALIRTFNCQSFVGHLDPLKANVTMNVGACLYYKHSGGRDRWMLVSKLVLSI